LSLSTETTGHEIASSKQLSLKEKQKQKAAEKSISGQYQLILNLKPNFGNSFSQARSPTFLSKMFVSLSTFAPFK